MDNIERKLADVVKERQVVYWGVGKICQKILQRYEQIEPDFFIDKFCHERVMRGKAIKRPSEINDWNNIYVIITCCQVEEIEGELKDYGLKKEIDFDVYRDFFDYDNLTIQKGIDRVKNRVDINSNLKSRILIVGDVWKIRNPKVMILFFNQYVMNKGKDDYVMLAHLGGDRSEEEAMSEVGFEVIDKPSLCDWDGYNPERLRWGMVNDLKLTNEEEKWIDALESIKLGDKGKELETRKATKSIFYYYKEIINILDPRAIAIWGGWRREVYILQYYSKKNNIPCVFMEHGWVPGTIQFDKGGIAGQSEYVRNPNVLEKISTSVSQEEVRLICKYVTDFKLDTRGFDESKTEEKILDSIDNNIKTIFLVGMDDYNMAMNPASDYWKQFVSGVVNSTQQAFELLEKECIKNNWNLIYKPHPCRDNLNDQTTEEQKQQAYIFYKMSVDRLIEKADVVVSISSAVEYKALMYEKPLVQIGRSSLTGKKCSYEITSKEDVGAKVKEALKFGMTKSQKENFEVFLTKLLDNYLWDDLSERPLRYGRKVEKNFLETII